MFRWNSHRRLQAVYSYNEEEKQEVLFEKDAVKALTFFKKDSSPYSSNFDKRFYLQRQFSIIKEHINFNTLIEVKNAKEMFKLFRLASQEKLSRCNGCFQPLTFHEFIPSDIINKHICPTVQFKNSSERFSQNYEFNLTEAYYLSYIPYEKLRRAPSIQIRNHNLEHAYENVGLIKLVYMMQNFDHYKFVINIKIQERQLSNKLSAKERLKKCLLESRQAIRRYNLPVPQCVDGAIIRKSNMVELLTLNLSNWKNYGYNLKTSKDELIYSQMILKKHNYMNIEDTDTMF